MAGAVIGLALWLRSTSVPYLVIAALATTLAIGLTTQARARGWGLAGAALLGAAVASAAIAQRRLQLVDHSWSSYSQAVAAAGVDVLRGAVGREVLTLKSITARALAAPNEARVAFDALRQSLGEHAPPYRGVALFRDTSPFAWAGDVRVPLDTIAEDVGVEFTPFYVALLVTSRSGARRAVATALLHAEAPGDRLAHPLDRTIVLSPELRGFEYLPVSSVDSSWTALRAASRDLGSVRPILLSQGEAHERLVERARITVGATLALALVVLGALSWRRPASLWQRLAALLVGVVAVGIVPFNAFSNFSSVFDPAVYFAGIGGPLTGSAAALAVTSALVLLACLAVARARPLVRTRTPALVVVLATAALGPFLMRDLARGITLPARGVTPTLWLAWQVALFLAATAVLLVGAGAGRLALGGSRGLPSWLAPLIAAVAATAAVPLWQAPGRWPDWYIVTWIVAMAALALARRSRWRVLEAGIVAACGAATLLWGAISRERVDLAQADVAQLSVPDPSSVDLLARFANAIDSGPPPASRADLLLRYVRSPLAAGGNAVGLASWAPGSDEPQAEMLVADFQHHPESERMLVRDARLSDARVWRTERTPQGIQTLLAVPHGDGSVTTVVVAPRTLLIPEDPFTSLIGLAPPASTEPPYDITLTPLPSPLPLTERPRWTRKQDRLHGDWRVPGATDSARVHVEVELRALDVLLPRGALVVLLDLLILGGLWTTAAAADGALGRWARSRVRRWAGSYRSRLTVTLFVFFVIPTAAFALWSYGRLQATDRESRVLLIRETLRTVSVAGGLDHLDSLSDRFDVPLFEYRAGTLRDASDTLYELLAPVGRYLPPDVAVAVGVESEVTATARPLVAKQPTLFGYRTVIRRDGERAVLAAPARTGESTLDRERRDIGILVLFVTSLGALAALWLSGLAARELERPVDALRRAALRIAGGGRYPGPDSRPAEEFVPVFSAFARMDADLAASRAALQEARRRTEAVLRDVASGVIATDREGVITIANPGAAAILQREIHAGTTLAALGASELHQRTMTFLEGASDSETFVLELDGRQLSGSLTRLTWGDGGAVLTLEDVTELARAQRVLAWGEMARQVAHEIKNPLTPIRLGVQHLQRARRDRRVDFDTVFEQNASRILAEIDRLDEIARAFSQYGAEPENQGGIEAVDAAAVVRDVVELERMGVSSIQWHTAGADDPAVARARKKELRDVLLNLLENARQAHARNVMVTVARRDGRVEILVSDDGDGISPEHLNRVFEPRFSTRTSGSGLGLAISRGLVAGWGGEMLVRSEPGKGTEMRITLTAVDEKAED